METLNKHEAMPPVLPYTEALELVTSGIWISTAEYWYVFAEGGRRLLSWQTLELLGWQGQVPALTSSEVRYLLGEYGENMTDDVEVGTAYEYLLYIVRRDGIHSVKQKATELNRRRVWSK